LAKERTVELQPGRPLLNPKALPIILLVQEMRLLRMRRILLRKPLRNRKQKGAKGRREIKMEKIRIRLMRTMNKCHHSILMKTMMIVATMQRQQTTSCSRSSGRYSREDSSCPRESAVSFKTARARSSAV
jgi:hypothetical protein